MPYYPIGNFKTKILFLTIEIQSSYLKLVLIQIEVVEVVLVVGLLFFGYI